MAVNLSPIGNGAQYFSVGGLPLSGGFLYTYTAGTSTPQPSYTTSTGLIANTNPIILDSGGRPPAEIWLTAGVAYKFVLTDALGTPIGPALDNISGIGDINNLTTSGNTVLGGLGNTLNVAGGALVVSSGNTALGGNLTVAGNATLGDAAPDVVTINAGTVALANNPTVSGNPTFSGNVSTQGNTTLGNALGDTLTVAADALKVWSDGRVSGNKLHNVGSVTGTTDQFIASGTYTPTVSNTTNITSTSNIAAIWIRVGNVVTVGGTIDIQPTAGSVLTSLTLTLPIASAFSGTGRAYGTFARTTTAGLAGGVSSDTVNNGAKLSVMMDGILAFLTYSFSFTYTVA